MAAKAQLVLEPRQLNEADREILDELHVGRASPSYLSEQTGVEQTYINQRLRRLDEHGHVKNLARGLWELVDDPRDAGSGDDGQGDDTDDRNQELERLRKRVDALREQLEAARTGQTDVDDLNDAHVFLDRALTDLPEDVPGRSAAEDARRILEEMLDDEHD